MRCDGVMAWWREGVRVCGREGVRVCGSPAHLARVALRLARLVEEVEGDLGRG